MSKPQPKPQDSAENTKGVRESAAGTPESIDRSLKRKGLETFSKLATELKNTLGDAAGDAMEAARLKANELPREGARLFFKAQEMDMLKKLFEINPELTDRKIGLGELAGLAEQYGLPSEEAQSLAFNKLRELAGEGGAAFEALQKDFNDTLSAAVRAKRIVDQAKAMENADPNEPAYKRYPKELIRYVRQNPWRSAAYLAAGYAGWKVLKWALSSKPSEKKEGSSNVKWIVGGTLVAVGLYWKRDKISKFLMETMGVGLAWNKIKDMSDAVARGDWKKVMGIADEAPDPKKAEHEKASAFLKEKHGVAVSATTLKKVHAIGYAEFRKQTPVSDEGGLAKKAEAAYAKFNSSDWLGLLKSMDDQSQSELAALNRFFDQKVGTSADFNGKSVDDVLEMIQGDPAKYVKAAETKTAAGKTPEAEKPGVTDDLKNALKELPGAQAVIEKYKDKIENGNWLSQKIAKYEMGKELAGLMYDNKWTFAFNASTLILWNGAKRTVSDSFGALTEPVAVLYHEKSLAQAGHAYFDNVSGLIVWGAVFGGVAGALKGGITGSAIGALKGGAKAGIFPLVLAKKLSVDAPYHLRHIDEWAGILKDEVALWKSGLAKLGPRAKNLVGALSDLKYKDLLRDHHTEEYMLLARKRAYLKEMLDMKIKVPGEGRAIEKKLEALDDAMERLKNDKKVGINTLKIEDHYWETLKESKTFKESPEAVKKLLEKERGKLGETIEFLRNNPRAKLAQAVLKDERWIQTLAAHPELQKQLTDFKFMVHFENAGVASRITRIMQGAGTAEQKAAEITGLAEDLRTQKIKAEKILEADVEFAKVHEETVAEIRTRHEEIKQAAKEMESGFKEARKANPTLTEKEFFESGAGKALKEKFDRLNGEIEGAVKKMESRMASHLSGDPKIDTFEKLPKDLKKIAGEKLAKMVGEGVELSDTTAKLIGKDLKGRLILCAPILALRAVMHGGGPGLGRELISGGVSVLPIAGTLHDLQAVATGRDLITGKPVGRLSSLGWAIVGAATDVIVIGTFGAGEFIKVGAMGLRAGTKGVKLARAAKIAAPVAKWGTGAMIGITLGETVYEWVTPAKPVVTVMKD